LLKVRDKPLGFCKKTQKMEDGSIASSWRKGWKTVWNREGGEI